jgi:phosphoribosylanthranilate isomerase
MVKVKICGITNLQDALLSARAGADIVGFIFAESKRRMTPEAAAKIAGKIPKKVLKAGVFVNEDVRKVNSVIKKAKLDIVQLSGNESVNYIKKIKNAAIIKVIRIKDKSNLLKKIRIYEDYVDLFLFDTYLRNTYGGTGRTFNWNIVKNLKTRKPFFVAGGITPENVCSLLEIKGIHGVDVGSGAETRPGKKSRDKIKRLFGNIRKTVKS